MKKLVTVIAIILTCWSGANAAQAAEKVLMLVPNDFMWPEYAEPKAAYEKAGYKVVVAGKYKEEISPDRRNFKEFNGVASIKPDLTFDEVNVNDYIAVTFVAGNGAWHDFFPNQKVHDIVRETLAQKKVLGLLCASTGLLGLVNNWDGKTPVAAGRKATGYFRVEGIISKLGQVKFVQGEPKEITVVTDANLVTGRNPESSILFGQRVVEAIAKLKN